MTCMSFIQYRATFDSASSSWRQMALPPSNEYPKRVMRSNSGRTFKSWSSPPVGGPTSIVPGRFCEVILCRLSYGCCSLARCKYPNYVLQSSPTAGGSNLANQAQSSTTSSHQQEGRLLLSRFSCVLCNIYTHLWLPEVMPLHSTPRQFRGWMEWVDFPCVDGDAIKRSTFEPS